MQHKLGDRDIGDGVRVRVVHSRKGKLLEEVVKNRKAEVALTEVAVEPGDTLDFIVDCMANPENDDFTWAPVIKVKSGDVVWDAAKEFSGPAPVTLTAWDKLAQVLLEMNEFAFVD